MILRNPLIIHNHSGHLSLHDPCHVPESGLVALPSFIVAYACRQGQPGLSSFRS